ncbi:MAG TPA: hypothetical protein EYP11_03425, partial [Aquificaceae bacterium]|nr:hypothetical protein [Aquificaceae bacterium]
TLKPLSGVSVDAGILTTNIGFEIADTYSNPNVLFGSVWWAQPFRYPGARITYDVMEGISLYTEYNKEYGGDNFAVGSLGSVGNISYAITYFDYNDTDTNGTNKNLIDLVLSTSLGPTTLGLNLDYQWLDDDSAYGIALYFIPTFGNLSVPIRLEYFNSGTSGIYLDEEGYTATVTPTLRPSENTFIRLDVSFISTENDVFGSEDDKTTASLELGFTF